MRKPRYIMIGGFLGAGKTTAVGALARRLDAQGRRVGLIINDQGSNLVDTANLRSQGFRVEEIPGGCFCCRFNSLTAAAEALAAEAAPEVFIGEPVGSCTDLVATVSYPLRRMYGEHYAIAPLSVLVDPVRAARVLGIEEGRKFSPKVAYIYERQLEEADFIVVNKIDLVAPEKRAALRAALAVKFPRAVIFEVSARSGDGLDAWFDRILAEELRPGAAMEVDYEIYAEGEALLGWLNATVRVEAAAPLDGNALIESLALGLQRRLGDAGAEIAHLKMTLAPGEGVAREIGEVAVISLVRNEHVPELSQRLADPLARGQLIVNCRAEAEPETLRAALEEELKFVAARHAARLALDHVECFKPGKPQPTHRLAELS